MFEPLKTSYFYLFIVEYEKKLHKEKGNCDSICWVMAIGN